MLGRLLAVRLLDRGSADQVLMGLGWAAHLDAWLGPSPALRRGTQVLVLVPDAAASPPAGLVLRQSQVGTWAVVSGADLTGIAQALAFAGAQAVERVTAPWQVQVQHGRVLVAGGPPAPTLERGVAWVTIC